MEQEKAKSFAAKSCKDACKSEESRLEQLRRHPYFQRMTPEQQTAAFHFNGPMLVLAGPGAGKTAVLTGRLAVLIDGFAVPPERILALTFTRKAADEMRERFRKLTGELGMNQSSDVRSPRIGTFHSAFYELLRQAGVLKGRSLLEDAEKTGLLMPLVREFFPELHPEELKYQTELLLEAYDSLRNKGRSFSAASEEASAFLLCDWDTFCELIRRYEAKKQQESKMDYEDMQTLLLRLLEEGRFPSRLRKRFSYFLVDEFQDINPVQNRILRYLSSSLDNVFAVGDEDQSIYGFRGAEPAQMLTFPNEHPGTQIVRMTKNFRSVPAVVALSSRLIRHNRMRYDKELLAMRPASGEPSVELISASTREREAFAVRDKLAEWHRRDGIRYGETAVLYRTHAQNAVYRSVLSDAGIPFRSPEAETDLERHWTTADFDALLNCVWGEHPSEEEFERVGKLFHISSFILRECETMNRRNGSPLMRALESVPKLSLKTRLPVDDLLDFAHWSQKHTPRCVLWRFIFWEGYAEQLRRAASESSLPLTELKASVRRIVASSKGYETAEAWRKGRCLKPSSNADAVELSTIHGAKGKEYRAVIVAAVASGILPHPLSEDEEEERRILYVALTRAKDRLAVSEFSLKKGGQSPFIGELFGREKK